MPTPLVIFDGDCGFCTVSADWGRRHLGTGDRVAVQPSQRTDLAALGTSPARARQELLFVDADGRVSGGAQAVAQWLRHARPWWARAASVALRLPPVRPLAAVGYRLVAAHRHRLPGSTDACRL